MAIRTTDDLANEGSGFGNQKATATAANISERFDDTTDNDNPFDDALQYIAKKTDECIAAINLSTTATGTDGVVEFSKKLASARTIGGVSFNGAANINLPGVNADGNQDTTGSAATLTTARTIGGVSFNGSANINLPGVNAAGNQSTSGVAATATILATARNIGGVSFNGSANINLPGVNAVGSQNTTGNASSATLASRLGTKGANITIAAGRRTGELVITFINGGSSNTYTLQAD